MENIEFKNACFEVLEILRFIKEDDLIKIPKYEIQILEENANYEHKFTYNPQKDIKEQQVCKLAKGIIAIYFYKYIASMEQKEKIEEYHRYNQELIEQTKSQQYDVNNIFKKKNKDEINVENENNQLIIPKNEKWYIKILYKIKEFFN